MHFTRMVGKIIWTYGIVEMALQELASGTKGMKAERMLPKSLHKIISTYVNSHEHFVISKLWDERYYQFYKDGYHS